MNYAEIKTYDIANGTGVRVSLFVSGCTHHCKNCFNKVAWDFDYGKEFTQNTIDYILDELDKDYYEGLSILGGEPFEPPNQIGLFPLVKQFKERFPNKSIWAYTGYLFDKDLIIPSIIKTPYTAKILKNIDILVDGKFIEEQKDLTLRFKGSKNQRIIDVQESLKQNKVVLSSLNNPRNLH